MFEPSRNLTRLHRIDDLAAAGESVPIGQRLHVVVISGDVNAGVGASGVAEIAPQGFSQQFGAATGSNRDSQPHAKCSGGSWRGQMPPPYAQASLLGTYLTMTTAAPWVAAFTPVCAN